MKIVLREHHIISLAGYIVELNVSFRNLIVVNHSDEPIKLEVPVLYEGWVQDHRDLGLEVIPVYDGDNYLDKFQAAKHKLNEELENQVESEE